MSPVETGRSHPHLYRLMFATPAADPTAAVHTAQRAHDLFVEIVAGVVGPAQAQQYGALLVTTAHGVTNLELSGHLTWDKWHAIAEDLGDLLIGLLPRTA
ncbi:TetR-like C-terminal domain-containing protein [Micromonospora sp. NBC_01412]|uniref:TetR-like C-terminal domain-containing protein n=1 Tax=Micromonospora sp. NBC_01412 TaxID=2903590 RepID=UPI00324A1D3E